MQNNKFKEDYKKYYEIGERIGKGISCSVYKAKNKKTNEIRAIKIIDIYNDNEEETEKEIKRVNNELNSLEICSNQDKNKYSIKLYEYYIYKNEFAIVMELCDDNLFSVLKKRKKGFNPEEIYKILNDLNNTFKIMLNNKIVHRDINLQHILIKYENKEKTSFIFKLSGYGNSSQTSINNLCLIHAGLGTSMAPF